MTGNDDCIFCKIAQGRIPAKVVYEDEYCLAFKDIRPAAPVHLLVIPRQHISSLLDLGAQTNGLSAHLMSACSEAARLEGLEEGGFRMVTNVGRDGGQEVQHLHFHILGGRRLSWPPG